MKRLITFVLAFGLGSNVSAESHDSHEGHDHSNNNNPDLSLVLDFRYSILDNNELELPGFQLGGEAELPEKGFALGHSELNISHMVTDYLYAEMTTAIIQEAGETEIELEEFFVKTLAYSGFSIQAGQFFSGIGYLNKIHAHEHDFVDRPLVYDALVGGHLFDTGVQVNWADTGNWLVGLEFLAGNGFPGGENEDNNAGRSFFVKNNGNFTSKSSWEAGISYYQSEFDVREAGAHGHGGEETEIDNEILNGEVSLVNAEFIYRYDSSQKFGKNDFTFQFEYFQRDEEGLAEVSEDGASASADYEGEQSGFYAQGLYGIGNNLRLGLRYDSIEADNTFTNFSDNGIDLDEFLEDSSLGTIENDPERWTLMLDYRPSHKQTLRAQISDFDNGIASDEIFILQYIVILGKHKH